jgi:alkaline phosphatase
MLALGQPRSYSTANAHSHNDYANPIPFYLAYQNGFGSIEADIYSIHDSLFVAHNKQDIRSTRTLSSLYLIPIEHALDSNRNRKLILLVDIKDDYRITLPLLEKELVSLKRFLSGQSGNRQLTIVISGNRPSPQEYKNYPLNIVFDDDLKLVHDKEEWKRVGLVSLPFYRISRWNGKEYINSEDSVKLKKVIDSVHAAKKQIRFWGAPDNEMSWELQKQLGVDLIGTDKIGELANFLRSSKSS